MTGPVLLLAVGTERHPIFHAEPPNAPITQAVAHPEAYGAV